MPVVAIVMNYFSSVKAVICVRRVLVVQRSTQNMMMQPFKVESSVRGRLGQDLSIFLRADVPPCVGMI